MRFSRHSHYHIDLHDGNCLCGVKIKAKLYLPKPWKHTEWMEVQLHSLINSALDGCQLWVLRLCPFTPEEIARDTCWRGDWVEPTFVLDVFKKSLASTDIRTPDRPARRLVTIVGYIFVDRASWYIRIIWTNNMHYFLLIYFNNKPVHVSSRFPAHHQEDQLRINSNWYSNIEK
jgi:hypothetical protein